MAEERTILLKVELDVDQLKKAQADAAKRVDALTEKRKELKNATEQDTIAIAENNAELAKARKELNATTKAIQAQDEAQKNATGSIAEMRGQLAAANQVYNNLSQDVRDSPVGQRMADDMEALKQRINEARQSVGDFTGNIGNYENAVDAAIKKNFSLTDSFEDVYGDGAQPLTTRIGELEDRMYEMIAAGEGVGEEFDAMLNEAARLRKVIIQTDAAVDQLAESGGVLGGALSIGEGVVQSYQTLIGVQALLGEENEEMLEILAKLQASQAILNGLEATNTALKKNSIRFTRLQTKANSALEKVLGKTASQSKVLRGALIASGVGALIVGVGLLIDNWDDLTAAFKRSEDGVKANTDAMLAANEQLADVLSAGDKLQKQLTDENLTREEKTTAIKDLQAQYPDLIANVDAEKDSLEDINTALELNVALLKLRAQEQAIAEKRSETYKKILDEEVAIQTKSNVGYMASAKSQLDLDSVVSSLAGTMGTAANSERDREQAQKIANKESRKTIRNYRAQIKALDDLSAGNRAEINAILKKGATGKKENDEEIKRQEELEKAREKWAKEEEKRLKRALDIANQLREAQIQGMQLRIDEEQQAIEAHYEFLASAAGNNTDTLISLERQKNEDLNEINRRQQALDKQHVVDKYTAEIEAAEDSAELQLELEANLALEIAAIDEQYRIQKEARDRELVQREKEINAERAENAQKAADEIALIDKEMQLERLRGSEGEFKAWQELQAERIRQVQIARDRELEIENQTEEEREAIRKRAAQQIQSINLETFNQQQQLTEQEKDARRDLALFIVQSAQQLGDTLFQIVSNRLQREINESKQAYNQQSQLLQDQLNAQLITQAQFNAQKSALDSEQQAKERELKKKQFERDRAADLINAAIATALAVTRALATPPAPNFVLSSIAAGLGAAQIGFIASQPVPEFKDGGQVKLQKSGTFGGKRHRSGGTKGYFDDGTRVEVERGEIFTILNRKASAAISQLSAHNQAHGGRSFYESGGVMKFQGGGAFTQNISQPIIDRYQQQNDLEQILRAQPAPIVDVKDINRVQATRVNVEDRATFAK